MTAISFELSRKAYKESCKEAAIHSAPQETLRNVLLARFGGLYNQKLATRTCTGINCNLEDGAGHILGGCAHRDMKALYIECHNAAGRRIAQEIRNGAHGNHVMIGDVGNAEKCQELESMAPGFLNGFCLTRIVTQLTATDS